MKRLGTLFIVLILCSAGAPAQGRRGGGGGGRIGGSARTAGSDERGLLLLLTALLSLSDSQRQQLTAIFDSAAEAAAPIGVQMEADTGELFDKLKSGMTDDQIKVIAYRDGLLTAQLLALQAQTFSKMWGILNSDQRSKVDATMYAHIGDFLANVRQAVPLAPVSPFAAPARAR